jgi:peptide/nickel transport system permease protein
MARYVIRRFGWFVVVLLLATGLTFVIFWMIPNDPTTAFTHGSFTARARRLTIHDLGLDRPVWYQYLVFVRHLFAGDRYGWPGFGFSFETRSSLRPILLHRAFVTAQLIGGSALLWVATGVPLGVAGAVRPRSMVDRVVRVFTLLAVSTPSFLVGSLLLYVFWFRLGWAAGTGYYGIGAHGFGTWLNHWILPWVTLSLLFAALYARMTRAGMLDVLGEDYVTAARAAGLPERTVILRYGLRAAATPLLTMLGMDIATLLSGAIVVETVFNVEGLGQLAIRSFHDGDWNALVGITMLGAFFACAANFVVDVLYAALDPRVRYLGS